MKEEMKQATGIDMEAFEQKIIWGFPQ